MMPTMAARPMACMDSISGHPSNPATIHSE